MATSSHAAVRSPIRDSATARPSAISSAAALRVIATPTQSATFARPDRAPMVSTSSGSQASRSTASQAGIADSRRLTRNTSSKNPVRTNAPGRTTVAKR